MLTLLLASNQAYLNDIVIGAMTCREETFEELNTIYILTIGVLENYRKLSIGIA